MHGVQFFGIGPPCSNLPAMCGAGLPCVSRRSEVAYNTAGLYDARGIHARSWRALVAHVGCILHNATRPCGEFIAQLPHEFLCHYDHQRDADSRAFQFGQKKVSIRFNSRYRIDFFYSIRFGNLINLPLVH